MVQVTLSSIIPSSVPADGWFIGYRIKDTLGAYTTLGPFTSSPIVFNTTDPAGTLYEGYITRDCGSLESAQYFWTTPCNCVGAGYVMAPSETQCQKVDTVAPTITSSGYCLAPSTNTAYSGFGSRIYTPGYNNATLALPPGSSGGFIYTALISGTYWANPSINLTDGPLNREGVWIDSDCNGVKDPLTFGLGTTIGFIYNHAGPAGTIYVGIAADNAFKLVVNGTNVAELTSAAGQIPFKFWHIIPINVVTGVNYINGIATGDGSVNDSIGMVGYNNTAAQIAAATMESQLNILFKSSNLRGDTYDVSTCPSGYSLDTSGGQGNYNCVRTLYKICNSIS